MEARNSSNGKAEGSNTNGGSVGKRDEVGGRHEDKGSEKRIIKKRKRKVQRKQKKKKERVREIGYVRTEVIYAEWMDEWRAWVENKIKRMQTTIDKLSREKIEMKGEIKRLKEQYGVVSTKIEEIRKKLEEIRKDLEIGRQKRELLIEKLNEAIKDRIGETFERERRNDQRRSIER